MARIDNSMQITEAGYTYAVVPCRHQIRLFANEEESIYGLIVFSGPGKVAGTD